MAPVKKDAVKDGKRQQMGTKGVRQFEQPSSDINQIFIFKVATYPTNSTCQIDVVILSYFIVFTTDEFRELSLEKNHKHFSAIPSLFK